MNTDGVAHRVGLDPVRPQRGVADALAQVVEVRHRHGAEPLVLLISVGGKGALEQMRHSGPTGLLGGPIHLHQERDVRCRVFPRKRGAGGRVALSQRDGG